jgi:cell division inhibitor SepF
MSVLDKFLDAIRLNDDYDEDDEFFDEEDLDEEEEAPKPRKRFFKKMRDEDLDEPEEKPARKAAKAAAPVKAARAPKPAPASKITPMRKRSAGSAMEVCVIRPVSMEDTREIADTLLDNCTVVLNLEGIDVEVAQRIIDFSSGACYAIGGSLQKVSSYIFILTPANVEISGDIQDILNGAVPSIRTEF